MRWLLLLAACNSTSGPVPGGSVAVFQTETSYLISAAFSDPLSSDTKCTHSAGDCVAVDNDCAKTLPPIAKPKLHSAGTITVGDQTLVPQNDGSYSPVTVAGTADPSLPVSASGEAIAAFSGLITIPAPTTLTPPPATVPRDQDLTLTWLSGTAGAKLDVLLFTVTLNPVIQISCSFDSAAGSGVIPSSLLQLIPAGADGHVTGQDVETSSQPRPTITLSGAARVEGFGSSTFN
jgi:hypothetical protein